MPDVQTMSGDKCETGMKKSECLSGHLMVVPFDSINSEMNKKNKENFNPQAHEIVGQEGYLVVADTSSCLSKSNSPLLICKSSLIFF